MEKNLEKFLKLFPYTRVTAMDKDLFYYFRNIRAAQRAVGEAQRVILDNGLSITAELEVWATRGVIFEISVHVELVPEEHTIAA